MVGHQACITPSLPTPIGFIQRFAYLAEDELAAELDAKLSATLAEAREVIAREDLTNFAQALTGVGTPTIRMGQVQPIVAYPMET